MKRKKQNWDHVPWTPFVQAADPPPSPTDVLGRPSAVVVNSRYQVAIFGPELWPPPFGEGLHLSIKTHDRSARHDWRDLQRIKNEVVGPEYDAVEIYPAESKLVDTSNQYHLFVFRAYQIPFGFQERLVAEGSWRGSKQRPFDVKPDDCLGDADFEAMAQRAIEARGLQKSE